MKKSRKQPKSEFIKLLEFFANGYKFYKKNEFWVDPLWNILKKLGQPQPQCTNYVLQPLNVQGYKHNLRAPKRFFRRGIQKKHILTRADVKLNSHGKVPKWLVIIE